MPNARRTVRASEIGSFIFCQRAWWYQRSHQPSLNQQGMAGGSEYHHQHSGRIRMARMLRVTSCLLIVTALVLLILAVRSFLVNT